MAKGQWCVIKGEHEQVLWWWNMSASWLWGWLHNSGSTPDKTAWDYTHVRARTHTQACKTCEVRISSLDCTNANFLVLVLFYGVMHEVITEGNQVKGTWRVLCTFFLAISWVLYYFKIKKKFLKTSQVLTLPTSTAIFQSCLYWLKMTDWKWL